MMGKNLKDVHPDLPSGIIEIQEGFMKSIPIPGTNTYLSGRFDILSKLEDGSYAIIDFKITTPDIEKILKKYSSQLHAYKFALENPADGKAPIKISKMGAVSINPDEMKLVDGKVQFTATPEYHEVKEDMDSFLKLVKEVSDVLEGPLPAESETCSLCIYRSKFTVGLGETYTLPF